MKKRRAGHLKAISKAALRRGFPDGPREDGGLQAERETGLPFEPPIAYFFRRFESLGDAIRDIRHEHPEERTDRKIERLRREQPLGWESRITLAEIGAAIQGLEEPLLEELDYPIRRDRDDTRSVLNFLERNASALSKILGRGIRWQSLVTATPWPEETTDPKGNLDARVIARARIGYLIGGLYLAYVEPTEFFEKYAAQVDTRRFEPGRLSDPETREASINDALFAWGEAALRNPSVRAAWQELSSDPAAAKRLVVPTSSREVYSDGRPSIVGGVPSGGERKGVHWLRSERVATVANWLDRDCRLSDEELRASEEVLKTAGLWEAVRDRRGDRTCKAPGTEALRIVAKLEGVMPSTIKQSVSRSKRKM